MDSFSLIQWVEPYVHHSKMVLIDDTLHYINVMGNQFVVFFYFYVCSGEPNGSTSCFLKTVPDKKIVVP
jgi:hypothetical protein